MAVIWYEKAIPTVPLDVAALVIAGSAGAAIVNVSGAVPVPALLVALKVTIEVPSVLEVPEIKPVDVFSDNPPGKPVAEKLVGVFVAVI